MLNHPGISEGQIDELLGLLASSGMKRKPVKALERLDLKETDRIAGETGRAARGKPNSRRDREPADRRTGQLGLVFRLAFGVPRTHRTIWDWATQLALTEANPFDKVRNFDIPHRGRVPWLAMAIAYVQAHAPADLVPMLRLGIMTCQRGCDMIRMGPEHRGRNSIWYRPKKTRKRRRAFHIPLATADTLELDRWAEAPVRFTNPRWLKPSARLCEELYPYSPKGAP